MCDSLRQTNGYTTDDPKMFRQPAVAKTRHVTNPTKLQEQREAHEEFTYSRIKSEFLGAILDLKKVF